jgi:hypothetical protein
MGPLTEVRCASVLLQIGLVLLVYSGKLGTDYAFGLMSFLSLLVYGTFLIERGAQPTAVRGGSLGDGAREGK